MNYYDDLLNKINDLIKNKNTDEARRLVVEELNAPYVPRDVLNKLEDILDDIGYIPSKKEELSDEEIEELLKGNPDEQLLAISILDHKNLRDYLKLCNDYLCSDGYINAKVLLIDSLIKQEINNEIKMVDDTAEYEFIPKYVLPVEESYAFLSGDKVLEDIFLKDPSKYKIAKDLLYKELMMKLPLSLESDEGIMIAIDIIEYVYNAFGDNDSLKEFKEREKEIIQSNKYYLS